MTLKTLGFPRMHKEARELRDFLPGFIRRLARSARDVVIEHGIGSGMGLAEGEYTSGLSNVRLDSNQACYAQDIVVQVRAPADSEIARMRPGTILCAMLHFATHARRVARLRASGITAFSMDSIVDDSGERLVEHLRGTSLNAVQAGFETFMICGISTTAYLSLRPVLPARRVGRLAGARRPKAAAAINAGLS